MAKTKHHKDNEVKSRKDNDVPDLYDERMEEKNSRKKRLKNKRKRDGRNADTGRGFRLERGNGKVQLSTGNLVWDYMGNVNYGKDSRVAQRQEELMWKEALAALDNKEELELTGEE